MTMRISATLALLASSLLASATASAYDWTFKVGAHQVDPKSDNGTLAGGTLRTDVSGDWRPTFQLEYFLNPNWGVEVLAATPFKHDVKLNGVKAAEVSHLPPTVSVQYHFNPEGSFRPYVGAGLNYTFFSGARFEPAVQSLQPSIEKHSLGFAAQAGFDVALNKQWSLNVDVKKLQMNTDIRLAGSTIGKFKIDPLLIGVGLGYRF